jgi:hypothetical protein
VPRMTFITMCGAIRSLKSVPLVDFIGIMVDFRERMASGGAKFNS